MSIYRIRRWSSFGVSGKWQSVQQHQSFRFHGHDITSRQNQLLWETCFRLSEGQCQPYDGKWIFTGINENIVSLITEHINFCWPPNSTVDEDFWEALVIYSYVFSILLSQCFPRSILYFRHFVLTVKQMNNWWNTWMIGYFFWTWWNHFVCLNLIRAGLEFKCNLSVWVCAMYVIYFRFLWSRVVIHFVHVFID